jgi:elongation factor G
MTAAIPNIRNIGIIAHIDAGKTTTSEHLLFYAGCAHRLGEVDAGTTTTDFDVEEQQRGITIYSACVPLAWRGCTINLIDTPGHVDFTAEVERSLRVLDGGVVVFDAQKGVEAQSETVWRQADKYEVPRLIFINKMDVVGADFENALEMVRERLHGNPVPVTLPIGSGSVKDSQTPFVGIIDLIEQKALYFDAATKGCEITVAEIPDSHRAAAAQWRERLFDTLTQHDERDVLTTAVLEGRDVPSEAIRGLLRELTIRRLIQPTLCGSGREHIGIQPLLDAICWYLPSPLDRPPVIGRHPNPKKDKPEVRKPSEDEPVCALVFKIVVDEHNEMYFTRVYSGVLKSRARLLNPRTGGKELISQLWRVHADTKEKIDEALAGDIVAIIGPKDSVTGDTLCDPNHPVVLEAIRFPETVISMAIEPETSAERKKLEETLKLLAKQDPTFTAKVNEETGQTIISGMGELHLEIISNRMQRDFGVKMRVHKPRVSYRETVGQRIEQTGVFERHVGGNPQFAAATVRIEPFTGESPVTVENALKPGSLPAEWEAAVMQALNDQAKSGGPAVGYPLMNVRFTLIDVATREGETTEPALRAAVATAVHEGLTKAGAVLLEPVMRLEVVTPDEFLGNITSDLNARRAIIVNTSVRGNLVVVDAEVPLSEMFGYSTQVRSLSQGRASYSMEPLRYDPAPPQVLREMMGG